MVRARFTLESGQRFIKMMDIVKDFSPQVNLQLGENGISLSVLDASHIALISVHFFPPSFSEYQCRQNVCLGMDLLTLSKLFKTKLPEDLLLLDYSPSSPDVLRLVFEQGEDRISEYKINLMDIDQEGGNNMDELPFVAQGSVHATSFFNALHHFNLLGEELVFVVKPAELVLAIRGDQVNGNIHLKQNTARLPKWHVGGTETREFQVSFKLKLICALAKLAPLAPEIQIGLGPELPLKLELQLYNAMAFSFYLAPQIPE